MSRVRLVLAGWVLSVVLVAVVVGIFSYHLGTGNPAVNWTMGTAYSAPGAISAKAGGWTYDIPVSVEWTDPLGSVHQDGRPGCLPADNRTHAVRLAWVWVSTPQQSWRQVVSVDCARGG